MSEQLFVGDVLTADYLNRWIYQPLKRLEKKTFYSVTPPANDIDLPTASSFTEVSSSLRLYFTTESEQIFIYASFMAILNGTTATDRRLWFDVFHNNITYVSNDATTTYGLITHDNASTAAGTVHNFSFFMPYRIKAGAHVMSLHYRLNTGTGTLKAGADALFSFGVCEL